MTFLDSNLILGCDEHSEPAEKAIVTVWARSMAHDLRNDYGTTLLCESSSDPETPAEKDELWRCHLTKTKIDAVKYSCKSVQ